jgi:hypothetical protein
MNECPKVEVIIVVSKDLSLMPPRFCGSDRAWPFAVGWVWGNLFDNQHPELPPYFYLREYSDSMTTTNGIIRYSDSPLKFHTALDHCRKMLPYGSTLKYQKIENCPDRCESDSVIYELHSDIPGILYQFSSRKLQIVESDFLELSCEYLPYAVVSNSNGGFGVPYLHQQMIMTGTFEGKPISGIGGWDRMYGASLVDTLAGEIFCGMSFVGIHKDGTREWGFVSTIGSGIGFYCKDGDEPVVASEVISDMEWERVPFLTDGTLTYTKAVFRFANKVIHYIAKYGRRGETFEPTGNPGMGQSSGDWYEGDIPYVFEHSFVFIRK